MSTLLSRARTTQYVLARALATDSRRGILKLGARARAGIVFVGPAACLPERGPRQLSTTKPSTPGASPASRAPAPAPAPAPASQGGSPAGGRPAYPERLVIYHAGTGRTVFLGWLKIATIFTFAFFGMVVAPRYMAADEPLWAVAYLVVGLVPFVFVAYTTSPFVTFINVNLPPFARTNRDMLLRFAKAPPPSTRLEISTLNLIGKPRVSHTTVGDLRPTRRRFGIVNYERDTAAEAARRRWWQLRAVGAFNIQPGMQDRLKTGWVWKEMAEGIGRRNKIEL
ncbi:hypothetical protein GQ53DRAFT_758462 [Thozetella sp. PMI_491]|nr:hypothetical protein GQ53DRAFT_758462 [Thozetella sp. PMI_491]